MLVNQYSKIPTWNEISIDMPSSLTHWCVFIVRRWLAREHRTQLVWKNAAIRHLRIRTAQQNRLAGSRVVTRRISDKKDPRKSKISSLTLRFKGGARNQWLLQKYKPNATLRTTAIPARTFETHASHQLSYIVPWEELKAVQPKIRACSAHHCYTVLTTRDLTVENNKQSCTATNLTPFTTYFCRTVRQNLRLGYTEKDARSTKENSFKMSEFRVFRTSRVQFNAACFSLELASSRKCKSAIGSKGEDSDGSELLERKKSGYRTPEMNEFHTAGELVFVHF